MKTISFLLILTLGIIPSASDQAIPFKLGPVKHYMMKTKIKGVTDKKVGEKSEFEPYAAVWGVLDAGNPAFHLKKKKRALRKMFTDDEFSMGASSHPPTQTSDESLVDLTPIKVVLGEKSYQPSNIQTKKKVGIFYYYFEIRGQNPIQGLPDDLLTGSITAVPPEDRTKLPVKVFFMKGKQWKKNAPYWVGSGEIEESTMISLYEFKKVFKKNDKKTKGK